MGPRLGYLLKSGAEVRVFLKEWDRGEGRVFLKESARGRVFLIESEHNVPNLLIFPLSFN